MNVTTPKVLKDNPFFKKDFNHQDPEDQNLLEDFRDTMLLINDFCFEKCVTMNESLFLKREFNCIQGCVRNLHESYLRNAVNK